MTREWNPERCMCSFAPGCGGTGVLECDGCGGETCVCAECYGHGEIDCHGCEDCARAESDDNDYTVDIDDAWGRS